MDNSILADRHISLSIVLKKFRSSLIGLIALFYFFAPNLKFIPFSGLVASVIFICWAVSYPKFSYFLAKKRVAYNLCLFILVFVYCFAIDIISLANESRPPVTRLFSLVILRVTFESYLGLLGLMFICTKFCGSLSCWFKFLLGVCLVQMLLAWGMFFNSSFRDWVLLDLSRSMKLTESVGLYSARGFGLAGDHLFSFAVQLALFSLLSIHMYQQTAKIRFLFLSIVMILMAFMNARIALIAVPFWFVLMFFSFSRMKALARVVVPIFSFVLIGALLFLYDDALAWVELTSPLTARWVDEGVMELLSIVGFSSAVEGGTTLDQLTDGHFYLPRSAIELTIGRGDYLFFSDEFSSDIGYVNFIYFGGVVFVFLTFLLIFIPWVVNFDRQLLALHFCCFVLLLIFNFKGLAFTNQEILKVWLSFLLGTVFLSPSSASAKAERG